MNVIYLFPQDLDVHNLLLSQATEAPCCVKTWRNNVSHAQEKIVSRATNRSFSSQQHVELVDRSIIIKKIYGFQHLVTDSVVSENEVRAGKASAHFRLSDSSASFHRLYPS